MHWLWGTIGRPGSKAIRPAIAGQGRLPPDATAAPVYPGATELDSRLVFKVAAPVTSQLPAAGDQSARSQAVMAAVWAVCAAGILIRFVNLDADPAFSLWIGYITDEGRWNETARNLALFRELAMYGISRIHLVLGAGYQAVNFVVFELAGVSLWSARLFSAVAGSLILLTSVLALRRHVDGLALLVGMAVLGFSTLLVNISRLAIPEMPALLFSLLAFLMLTLGRRGWATAFGAGVVFACAVAMKGTTVLMVPGFVFVVFATRGRETAGVTARLLASFAAGLVVPAALGLAVAGAVGLLASLSLANLAAQLAGYIELATPFVVAGRFLNEPLWAPVMCLLLGLWYGSWVGGSEAARRDPTVARLYAGTAVWSLWALLVWATEAYSPGRYLVHVLLPLTLHAIVVATIWQRGGGEHALRSLMSAPGRAGLLRTTWLALPTGLLLGSAAARVAVSWALFDVSRLSHRAALLLVVVVLVTLMAGLLRSRRVAVRVLLTFPGLFGAFWLINSQFERPLGFWVGGSTFEQVTFWAMALLVAGASLNQRYKSVAVVIAVLIVAAGAYASSIIGSPTYSIRDASRDLGRRYASGDLLCSVQAGSLFLENKLRYRDDLLVADQAAGVVILAQPEGKPRARAHEVLKVGFVEESGYDLQVSAGYWWEPGVGELPERFSRIEVFRRSGP